MLTWKAVFKALVLTSVVSCALAAHAQTANTVYMSYSFYGPPGKYRIELFEVGAPFPSRQDNTLVGGYNGQYTYRRSWSYISKGRTYFIRVTNTESGARKQTQGFRVPASWGDSYDSPHFNWYNR